MASSTIMAGDEAEQARAFVRLRCWGDLSLTDAVTGVDLTPRGRKARAMLAYLALHPGKPISRERLAGLFWGDRAEPQARASLRQAIAELRGRSAGDSTLLKVTPDSLSIDGNALATDIGAMRAACSANDFARLLELLPESDELLFANLDGVDAGFDDWLRIERTRQRDALTALIADAVAAAQEGGRSREARALYARLKEFDPDIVPTAGPPARAPAAPAAVAPPPQPPRGQFGQLRWRTAALFASLLMFSVLALAAWQVRRDRPTDPVAIAVLPFRDLSGRGEPYFAEGVSEEILGQLARNPGLKVVGRTSAWSFREQALDAPTLGRKLGVEYLVEGSVRSMARRVRVDVALVRARDGAQIWSDRLDGSLDDVFAMQDGIGRSVAGRLAAGATMPVRKAATARGDAYQLYLTARGLFRTRKADDMQMAVALLRQAVALDPQFALGWAQLGGALSIQNAMAAQHAAGGDGVVENQEAERYVRHSLALQPDLAEGHAMLGLVLGFDSAEAGAHLKRAVQLDPHDAQKQFWLSHALGSQGDFTGRLNALRRAVAIDPTWHRSALSAGAAAWEMGYRDEGARYAARLPRAEPFIACAIDFHMGRVSGDYSRIARTSAAARIALEDAQASTLNLGFVALHLGQAAPARALLKMSDAQWRLVLTGAAPDRATLDALYRESAADDRSGELLLLAFRQLLNAGKGGEIVRLFDAREGRLSGSAGWNALTLLEAGPSVALALRQTGRHAEAARLLARIDASIRRSMARGRVPHWHYAAAAQAWSAQGRRDQALGALETAVTMGWTYVSWTPRSDIADLPAFRSLRGEPRFERIRARLNTDLARERRETGVITV